MKTNFVKHRAVLPAILVALVAFTPCAAHAQNIAGDWHGTLSVGPGRTSASSAHREKRGWKYESHA